VQDDFDEVVHYDDSQGCARVSFQDVYALEVPVDDGRKPVTRRGSRRVTAFFALWMVMIVLAMRVASGMEYMASVFLPSVDGDDALVVVLAMEFAFVVYCGMVQSTVYTGGILRLFGVPLLVWTWSSVPELCAELCSRTLFQNFVPELCSRTLKVVVVGLLPWTVYS